MKVALLTIWHEKNYGAELQAYATIKALKELGCDVKMIDIRLSDISHPNLNGKIGNILSKITPCHKKFKKFWKDNIPTTSRYKSLLELQSNPPEADIYIVGSDQVWNPEIVKEFLPLYLLDFGKENIKRISYASSFGSSDWHTPQYTEQVKKLLSKFQFITCRELSGVNLLKKHFNIQAYNVLDPTLLFDNYSELIKNNKQKKTLAYYPLDVDPELCSKIPLLAKRLGLEPINTNHKSFLIGSIVWDRTSIEEWVENITTASFVITRSFHGLAFSLLSGRQFAVCAYNNNRSTRLTNLLELLDLKDRFYNNLDDLINDSPWERPIDYSLVGNKLKKLREQSWELLKQALQ